MLKVEQGVYTGRWLVSLGEPGLENSADAGAHSRAFHGAVAASDGNARALHLVGEPGFPPPNAAEAAGCVVVFDGVLYNREELCDALTDALKPQSDAELALQAYLRWGESLLSRVKGIFALCIWDSRRKLLVGARDPIGTYPLFYTDTGRELLLSTSIEPLLEHPRVSKTLNRAALADHLCHRWPKLEETFYEAIRRVPPNHTLRVTDAGQEHCRYWDPAPDGVEIKWTEGDELDRFDELLDQVVGRYLQLGPAGIFLSGGLDSVSVAAVAAEYTRCKGMPTPWALSLAFPESAGNEEPIQRGVAASLGLPQVVLPFEECVGPDGLLRSVIELGSDWPMPRMHPWAPAYHRLTLEGQRRGCRVVLTGGGGDEWLGVSPFYAADLLRSFNLLGLYRYWNVVHRSQRVPRLRAAHSLLWRFGARPILAGAARDVLDRVMPGAYTERWRRRIARTTPTWIAPDLELRRELFRRAERAIPGPRRGSLYAHEAKLPLDHALTSMELEELFEGWRRTNVRVLMPYWDADMIDFLYRVPPERLTQGGRTKGLVRQTVARRFPELGFKQQKKVLAQGYHKSVMLSQGPAVWQELGGAAVLAKLGIVDRLGVDSAAAAMLGGARSHEAYRVWEILNLEAWLRRRGQS